jgi:hypothetical protein
VATARVRLHAQARIGQCKVGSLYHDKAVSRVSFYVLLTDPAAPGVAPRVALVKFFVKVSRPAAAGGPQPGGPAAGGGPMAGGTMRLAMCRVYAHNIEEGMFLVEGQAVLHEHLAVEVSSIACMLVKGECSGADAGKVYFMRYNSTSRIG